MLHNYLFALEHILFHFLHTRLADRRSYVNRQHI